MKKSELQKLIKEAIAEIKQENLNENPALMALGRAAATAAGAAAGEKLVDKYLEDDEDPNDEHSDELQQEGKLGKFLGGAAFVAALLAGNAKIDQSFYKDDAQIVQLEKDLLKAKEDKDKEKIKDITRKLKDRKIAVTQFK